MLILLNNWFTGCFGLVWFGLDDLRGLWVSWLFVWRLWLDGRQASGVGGWLVGLVDWLVHAFGLSVGSF
jgi:hypothetical protein